VATSDQPALVRLRAALLATTIAEYFPRRRSQGPFHDGFGDAVCMAQREVGLAVGEPPTAGYTPSVFSLLPRLLNVPAWGAGFDYGAYTV